MARRLPSALERGLRDGAVVAGLLFAAYLFVIVAPVAQTVGFDAFAYWSLDLSDPYAQRAGGFGAFTYSPVIARLFAPFSVLPWWQFLFLWLGLLVGSVIWLGWTWTLAVLAFPPVALELFHGNVHLLMAVAIAAGFRYPVAWAFVVLTKVTPGVGLIWFLVRREWRSLAVVGVATAAIVGVSLLVDAPLWVEWVSRSLLPTAAGAPLGQPHIPVPLAIRLPLATVLVAWGGRTDRPWTVPAAAALALPVLWPAGFAILAAIPAIRRTELRPIAGKGAPQRAPEHGGLLGSDEGERYHAASVRRAP